MDRAAEENRVFEEVAIESVPNRALTTIYSKYDTA